MSETPTLMVRKRGAKVNSKQKKILLQSMADNPLIYTRKVTADFTINHHKAFWRHMCAVLNIHGPPRKTVDSWKKAWKDIKLRYQKAGVDLKEIINSLKHERVVNAQFLLEKADEISTLTKEKGDIEQALREAILSEADAAEFLLSDMEVPLIGYEKSSRDNSSYVKSNESKTIYNIVGDNEEVEIDELHDTKPTKFDDDGDLCEIAYEEILESDLDGLNDSDAMSHSDTSSKRKLSSKQNGYLSTEDSEPEPEEEILKQGNPPKKLRLLSEASSTNTFPCSSKYSHRNESTGILSNSILNDLLVELRQHNKIQSERLALDKKRFETKKKSIEESLAVKRDLAKAHNSLAKSIKTFIDNISFDT